MIRKVIQSNPTTLVVSLPKKWVTKNKISKGDELHVHEHSEGGLLIGGGQESEEKTITMHIPKTELFTLKSYMGALYRAGYTEIQVTFDDASMLKDLQLAIENFFGFELFDIQDTACTIKSVIAIEPKEIKNHLLKINYIL